MAKKITLIVGGTRGIGSAIKQAFIERGDHVYTASRRDLSEANHIKVNLPSQIDIDANIKLNYLIFAHRYRGDDWNEDFDTTVKACDVIIRQFQNSFLDESAIVILGSNAGHFVLDEQAASYHSSRAALVGLVKFYAVRLGHKGIRCNSVLPTTIIKPENESFFTKDNEIRKMIEQITPLQRMGNAKDIANTVKFLCSDSASFITGQSIFVDGGLSIVGQESIARAYISGKYPNAR